MPRRGQPPDDPSSAPESGTVREFDDEVNPPADSRGDGEKSADLSRRPADQSRKDDPSNSDEEK